MFKNLTIFRIGAESPLDAAAIEAALAARPFTPCEPSQASSIGWVPPRGQDHGAMLEAVGGQWLLKVQTETKTVPTEVVGRRVDAMAEQVLEQTGRKPSKKQKKELKEQAMHELLPAAFPRRAATLIWIDPAKRLLFIDSATAARTDLLSRMLVASVDGLNLQLLATTSNPAGAMAAWLAEGEAPSPFSIDRACELRATDGTKAVVRYGKHPLDTAEVRQQVQRGMEPTRLEVTFKGRITFTLTDSLRLRGIHLGDVVFQSDRAGNRDGDGFDADAAIATGELSMAVAALVEALGGELQQEAPASTATFSEDELIDQAKALVIEHQRASISMIQRYLQIGYNRAARLLESLEAIGAVSPMNTSGHREVLAA